MPRRAGKKGIRLSLPSVVRKVLAILTNYVISVPLLSLSEGLHIIPILPILHLCDLDHDVATLILQLLPFVKCITLKVDPFEANFITTTF